MFNTIRKNATFNKMLDSLPFFLLSLLFIETTKLPIKVYDSILNISIVIVSVLFFYTLILLLNKSKTIGLVSTLFFWLALTTLKNKYVSI